MIVIRPRVRSVHFAPRRKIIQWQENQQQPKDHKDPFHLALMRICCCGRRADTVAIFFFFFCPAFLPKWKRKTWWETVRRGRRQTHSRGTHRLSVFDLVAVFSKSNYSTTDGHANSKDPAAIRSTLFSNLARKLNQLILLNNLLYL